MDTEFSSTARSDTPFQLGDWTVFPETGRIQRGDEAAALEPKVMGLLQLLAKADGAVLSREEIEKQLWAQVIVGEDTVARTVSRLRRALGDRAQNPAYIETLPKRGYRLLVPVSEVATPAPAMPAATRRPALTLAAVLIIAIAGCLALFLVLQRPAPGSDAAKLSARADNLYMQFTHSNNEAAIALYEKALAMDKDFAPAQAGLANALVQRVIRWPSWSSVAGARSLQEALERDMHQSASATKILARATALAERAVRLAPRDADALKALGFAYTAQNRLDLAEEIYLRAISLDEDAWEAMINLGEIYTIKQDSGRSLAMLEQAFDTMARVYHEEPQRVGPWQAALGVLVGKKKEQVGAPQEAELWYRRTLEISPYEPEATSRLAALLREAGDVAQANRLCSTLTEKIGPTAGCPTELPR